MPTFEEARNTILQHVAPLGPEVVPVLDAAGRVLAADVAAPWDGPRWDNSAMDGFAVRSADCAAPGELRVAGFIPAGAPFPDPVAPGTAARILTGAALPHGADAVAPLETVDELEGRIRLRAPVERGAHVRRRGEDFRGGDVVLPAGTLLAAADVSLLATFSRLSIPVVRRPRVAILSTGDELVPPGEPLGPGQIHDSNSLAVAAAVKQAGGEPLVLGIARDDRAALAAKLREGLQADALVTTAGVSMGDRDYVRGVLDELSVRQLFWKVEVKPGRPTAFGMAGPRPVFSLPGNPVATLLMFEELVRPALLRMMGRRDVLRRTVRAVMEERIPGKPGRLALVRVALSRRDGGFAARLSGPQETGMLRTSVRADGIALVPADVGTVAAGGEVDVHVVREEAIADGAAR